jgi:S-adenosylmethionine-diacylgycerolhomoserine-N-methlytransferase
LAPSRAHAGTNAAEHMDAIYRYQRYIYDATRKYYLLGRDRLLSELEPPAGGSVLEIACGTGRNLILAARRYPTARCYGFDISAAMLETAQAAIARNGLATRISVTAGDAAEFSSERLFGVAGFDRVMVSYALSMIPPWRTALQRAMDAVGPGGRLHVVDFGEQERLPRAFRSGLRSWLAKFSVEPRAELEAELERLAAHAGSRLACEHLHRGYATYAVLEKGR